MRRHVLLTLTQNDKSKHVIKGNIFHPIARKRLLNVCHSLRFAREPYEFQFFAPTMLFDQIQNGGMLRSVFATISVRFEHNQEKLQKRSDRACSTENQTCTRRGRSIFSSSLSLFKEGNTKNP